MNAFMTGGGKKMEFDSHLQLGELAPDFLLSSTQKEKIALSDYRNKKNVLVAFYPLDFTPG
ncbi:redoxin domain-containing protein [Bacillus tamaricis]|uniref:Redoxin domain-containing protein n=3 Tax=Evansella tamaricis TaxID=2069301 RepID=A0ABS6JD72_9BACI|nr:redoxin domain-containing protein [Evansella tamaricis]